MPILCGNLMLLSTFGGGSCCSDQHCHTASDLEVSVACTGDVCRKFSASKDVEFTPPVVKYYFSTGLYCQHTLLTSLSGCSWKVPAIRP